MRREIIQSYSNVVGIGILIKKEDVKEEMLLKILELNGVEENFEEDIKEDFERVSKNEANPCDIHDEYCYDTDSGRYGDQKKYFGWEGGIDDKYIPFGLFMSIEEISLTEANFSQEDISNVNKMLSELNLDKYVLTEFIITEGEEE